MNDSKHTAKTPTNLQSLQNIKNLSDREIQERTLYLLTHIADYQSKIYNNVKFWFWILFGVPLVLAVLFGSVMFHK